MKYLEYDAIAVFALTCETVNRTLDSNKYVKEDSPKTWHLEILAAVHNMLMIPIDEELSVFDESIEILRHFHEEVEEEDKRCFYIS